MGVPTEVNEEYPPRSRVFKSKKIGINNRNLRDLSTGFEPY